MTLPAAGRPRRVPWSLIACVLTAVIVWLAILPRLGQQAAIRRHIERNRANRIEPDAMFYTEVGPLDGISLEHRHGEIIVGRLPMAPGTPAGAPSAQLRQTAPRDRAP